MPIRLTCPSCQTTVQFPDQQAGQTGPCPQCGEMVGVPSEKASPTDGLRTQRGLWGCAIAGLILWVLVCGGFLTLCILQPWNQNRRGVCLNNLHILSQAMLAYERDHGSFPPASGGGDGRPKCSWRVLLLPYLDRKDLFDQYHFDEPWNSPHNMSLAETLPIFSCPSSGLTGSQTTYMMVVGPGTVSDGPSSVGLGDISDGPSQTLLLIDSPRKVCWLEPEDIDIDTLCSGLKSGHGDVMPAVFCDGHVQGIATSIDPRTLRAICTIAGGEEIDPDKR
jgi:prepilin-type processing-associated H-X9-DG protein